MQSSKSLNEHSWGFTKHADQVRRSPSNTQGHSHLHDPSKLPNACRAGRGKCWANCRQLLSWPTQDWQKNKMCKLHYLKYGHLDAIEPLILQGLKSGCLLICADKGLGSLNTCALGVRLELSSQWLLWNIESSQSISITVCSGVHRRYKD